MAEGTCSIVEDGVRCGGKHFGYGWCGKHYMRWRKHGSPLTVLPRGKRRPVDPVLRFWPKVDKNGPVPEHRPELGPCWLYPHSPDKDGYGRIALPVDGIAKTVKAHRFAHEQLVGPIPDHLQPDHLCRNTTCVKVIADANGPAHIELVTPRENTLRNAGPSALNARKTHCKHGHEFTEENTYINKRGGRVCRACQRRHDRARRSGI